MDTCGPLDQRLGDNIFCPQKNENSGRNGKSKNQEQRKENYAK